MDTLTLKIEKDLSLWLQEQSKKMRRSKSAIVRDAIALLRAGNRRLSALESAGEAVGSVQSRVSDLGSNKIHLKGFGR